MFLVAESKLFLSLLTLGAVTAAAYTDLTENIVPNTLTFPLTTVGILARLALGVLRGDPYLAILGLAGATAGFLLSFPLYRFGGFGGGDVKLMVAVGALLPVAPVPVVNPGAVVFTGLPLFPLTVLIDGLILSSPLIVGYALLCLARGEGVSAKKVAMSELDPGVVPAEAVWVSDGEVRKGPSLPQNHESCYADPRDTRGLRDQQVEGLIRLSEEGNIEPSLRVKRTFPFAPVIAAGAFSAVFFGNLYWVMLVAL